MANSLILTLLDSNFEEEVLKKEEAILVDFWAPWCGPCKMLTPVLDELATEIKDENFKIGKVNVDENMQLAEKYQVSTIPTLLIFKNGEIKETLVGFRDKNSLKELIKKYF
jgi:thioredoxin 1